MTDFQNKSSLTRQENDTQVFSKILPNQKPLKPLKQPPTARCEVITYFWGGIMLVSFLAKRKMKRSTLVLQLSLTLTKSLRSSRRLSSSLRKENKHASRNVKYSFSFQEITIMKLLLR